MRVKQPCPQKVQNIDIRMSARTEEGPSVANINTHSPSANRKKSVQVQHKHDHCTVKMKVRPVSTASVRYNERNPNHRENLNRNLPARQIQSHPHCRQSTADPRSAVRQRRFACLKTVRRRKTTQSKVMWKLLLWRQLSRTPRTFINNAGNPKTQLNQQKASTVGAKAEGTARSLSRLVRSLQLCSSSSESSPSPPASPTRFRRIVRAYRTRGYGNQLKMYQALRSVKKYKQSAQKLDQVTSETSDVKGVFHRMKSKRCLPATQSLPATHSPPATKKLSKKTCRRLWRHQLDSSGSDSPVSECSANITPVWFRSRPSGSPGTLRSLASGSLTSFEAASPTIMEHVQAAMSPAARRINNEGSPRTLGRALRDKRNGSRVTLTNFKQQQNFADANFRNISSCSKSSELLLNQPGLPSTPHVCERKKKRANQRSSAVIKHNMQLKAPTDHEVKVKHHSDKFQLKTEVLGPHPHYEMSSSPSPAWKEIWSPADSKHGCQKTSYSPSQMETRSEALSHSRAMAPLPKRSKKCPASKTLLVCFNPPTSTSSKTIIPTTGYNCTPRTPFRKPDTPRPKIDLKSLKLKKVLEQNTESTKVGVEIVSDRQGQSSKKSSLHLSSFPATTELPSPVFETLAALSPQQGLKFSDCSPPIGNFDLEPLHSTRSVLNYEALYNVEERHDGSGEVTGGQDLTVASQTPNTPTLNDIRAAVHSQMEDQEQLSTPHPSPNPEVSCKQSTKAPSSGIIQTIFGSTSFIMGVRPVEAELGSVSPCTPSRDCPALPGFGATGQDASHRGLSGCQSCAVTVEPLKPDHAPHGQEASHPVQPRPFSPTQGGEGDNHMQ